MGTVKTILLTGATGYLGSKLLSRLLAGNFQVCIVKRETSSLVNIETHLDKIKWYNNEEKSIALLFEQNNIDLIIHTATLYGRKAETFLEIKEANLDFPAVLLNYAIKHKIKYFINTGTSLPVLANTYSLFKSQFSQCLNFGAPSINSVNIVLEHFYGPKDDDSKFITSMIKKMLSQQPEIQLTAGTQLRDFIYIEDVLDAYMILIENLNQFEGYNEMPVGYGDVVSIRKIVELIKHYSNSKSHLDFGAIAMRDNELMKSNADITKLTQLGWKAKYSLDEGLKITINDMIANIN